MDVEGFLKLKKEAERLRSESDRIQGALGHIYKQLEQEFGCKTLEEAESMLKKLEKQERMEEKEYHKELDAFRKRWLEKLDG